MKKGIKKIYEPVYKVWGVILICPQAEFNKRIKALAIDGVGLERSDAGAVLKLIDDDGCVSFLVWFRKKPNIEDIVHESWHLASDILESRGVEYEAKSNNEAFAYYIEFWFNTIRGAIK